MAVSQQQLLETIKTQLSQVPARSSTYRNDLLNTLAEIVMLERVNRLRRTNIQQEVKAKCEALGVLVAKSPLGIQAEDK